MSVEHKTNTAILTISHAIRNKKPDHNQQLSLKSQKSTLLIRVNDQLPLINSTE
ncbi:hypothetical protein VCHA29O37_40069 [Vibrio chagasii]|nr:hypothetical protein VCHA29O37_40069 [Vibrio chagasii]